MRGLVPWLATGLTVAGVGLGLTTFYRQPLLCDSPSGSPNITPAATPANPSTPTGDGLPPPPQSSVSLYELSFGTVAGVCAGVFVKKGAKMAAWFLGGIFVLLQYLNSASVVRVDWSRVAHKFENLFYTREASGAKKPPTIVSLWNWLVNFLTADFQPRASFLAGFALGLRVG
ncbi:FUN14 family-domain-containing protein [Crepidotus variabilis]|uniref:FUN14 family-domain-containing protein n=1 Tax=Crepidotus variabilis TaxID=179855 RepID=A0A9P6EP07_9AGAR|nr:FUN14 family-domain-containing protein [Crepidotus variabilis]